MAPPRVRCAKRHPEHHAGVPGSHFAPQRVVGPELHEFGPERTLLEPDLGAVGVRDRVQRQELHAGDAMRSAYSSSSRRRIVIVDPLRTTRPPSNRSSTMHGS